MAKRSYDPKAPDSQVRITDFGGMSPGTDQHDNNPGLSWYQVNVVPFHPGELRVRGGFSVVRFEADPADRPASPSPPQVRSSDAATRILLHPDARRARTLTPESFAAILLSGRAGADRRMYESSFVITPSAVLEYVPGDAFASAASALALTARASAASSTPGPVGVAAYTRVSLDADARVPGGIAAAAASSLVASGVADGRAGTASSSFSATASASATRPHRDVAAAAAASVALAPSAAGTVLTVAGARVGASTTIFVSPGGTGYVPSAVGGFSLMGMI